MSNPSGLSVMTARAVSQMRRQYQEGGRDVDLADWFNVSEATVRYHTKDIRRPHPRRTFDYAKAKALKDQGLTILAISRRFGVCDTAVSRAIKRYEQGERA